MGTTYVPTTETELLFIFRHFWNLILYHGVQTLRRPLHTVKTMETVSTLTFSNASNVYA